MSLPPKSRHGLEIHGISGLAAAHWNLPAATLVEESLNRDEGILSEHGALVVETGAHTGRSPNDRFVVREPENEGNVWWGKVNVAFDPEHFKALRSRMFEWMKGREAFVQDVYAGADPEFRLKVRVVTEYAWHSIFARNMFIPAPLDALEEHLPEFTVVNMPSFKADPARDHTNSETFIIVNFAEKQILIGGTGYAGETKKSVFSVMNYLLPLRGAMSMHCSANVGQDGETAVFFGLSGTGKTTLSADPERTLIGDDEHGWSENGVFNFEGGCYAKVIKLSKEAEPEIYETTRTFGTILENVVIDPVTRQIDLDDESLTENTRGSYPISQIPNASHDGRGGNPKNIVMLTADAFGVLPPISKLTPEQAMYHFLSGYTAKVAGTERGVTEPQATFSTCFGAPFMVHHPNVYGELLRKKIAEHGVHCWLVNTGWTGGPYGVGERMKIKYTRAMVRAALGGHLDHVGFEVDPIFGLAIPTYCPEVPDEVLNPRSTWSDKQAYDEKAQDLANRFEKNFEQFAENVTPEVRDAGPKAAKAA